MYEIQWQTKAIRQLEKIKERMTRHALRDAVSELQYFPKGRQIKMLANHKYGYRLRVGRYRVMFNVWGVIHVISIEEVKKRDESTY